MGDPTAYIDMAYLKTCVPPKVLRDYCDDDDDEIADAGVLEEIVNAANSEIDSKIQLNPGLPIEDENITAKLKYIGGRIATYYVYLRYPPVPEDILKSHDAAIKKLDDIRDSLSGTGDEEDVSSNITDALSANYDEDDRIFTREWLDANFPRRRF